MLSINLDVLLFLMIYQVLVSNCHRRIEGGNKVTSDKPYIVYLVKASLSDRNYDYWLCGGALVTHDFILTSAACVEDVKYLFVVAGYNKYITNEYINDDKCTRSMKKKVVFTCVPISYEFDFDQVDKWSQIDIALAKVESPYNFEDITYKEICSYIPKTIPIHFDPKYQMPDTDCMVLGWGHEKIWRKHKDNKNYNSEDLKYAATLVIDKKACISEFQYYPKMTPVIEQYMICTSGKGKIDDAGQPEVEDSRENKKTALLSGCSNRRMDQQNSSCKEEDDGITYTDFLNARREVLKTNKTYYHHNYTTRDYIKDARNKTFNRTRKTGICQNDHGGPLVAWVGTTEVLIGVASVFKIDEKSNCIGPYLHTSTQSNAAFIDCVLNENDKKNKNGGRRNALCDSPPSVRGFDMVENHISWKDHPAGPAENELLEAKFGPQNK